MRGTSVRRRQCSDVVKCGYRCDQTQRSPPTFDPGGPIEEQSNRDARNASVAAREEPVVSVGGHNTSATQHRPVRLVAREAVNGTSLVHMVDSWLRGVDSWLRGCNCGCVGWIHGCVDVILVAWGGFMAAGAKACAEACAKACDAPLRLPTAARAAIAASSVTPLVPASMIASLVSDIACKHHREPSLSRAPLSVNEKRK
eukprot:1192130-Prorocentrum_minimum.AAC.2